MSNSLLSKLLSHVRWFLQHDAVWKDWFEGGKVFSACTLQLLMLVRYDGMGI